MPDSGLVRSHGFDQSRRRLGAWLHAHMEGVRSLADREVELYRDSKGVVAGWEVQSADSGRRYFVLIDGAFPFSKVQIACVSEGDRYLQWPHVEEDGFLCLPAPEWLPCEKLGVSAQDSLQRAEQLISNCQSEDFVRTESQKEFVSYWARHSGTAVRSLIDVAGNRAARVVCARKTGGGIVVGESSEQLDAWCEKNEEFQGGVTVQAVFAFVEDAPFLPFPQNSREFFDRFIEASPEINRCLAKQSPFQNTLIILASSVQGGVGLWGCCLRAASSDGFRPSFSAKIDKRVWRRCCEYRPVSVWRVDGSWVHGRDRDVHYSQISQKHVVVLGAGSLGSQVASRLAQAGIGRIDIVDPQELAACNVGRHALGMGSLGKNKAQELARVLSEKYPHGDYSGVPAAWQAVLRESSELFEGADLVVCCMGETPQDLAWSAHHQSGKLQIPSLYGWLGTQGATGHALLIAPSGPGLSCFIDPGGYIKGFRNLLWKTGSSLKRGGPGGVETRGVPGDQPSDDQCGKATRRDRVSPGGHLNCSNCGHPKVVHADWSSKRHRPENASGWPPALSPFPKVLVLKCRPESSPSLTSVALRGNRIRGSRISEALSCTLPRSTH